MDQRFRTLVMLLPVLLLLALPATAFADLWDRINFQGVLTDADGEKVEGSKTVYFSLWTQATEGDSVWGEAHPLQNIVDGLINVELGSYTPLSSLPRDVQYYLQIQVAGDTPMTRIRLNPTMYAINAQYLGGYDAGNGTGMIPLSNGTKNVNLNADQLDGMDPGNESGDIPLSNGVVNDNLNADKLDGLNADAFADSNHTHTGYAEVDHTHTVSDITDFPGSAAAAGLVAANEATTMDLDTAIATLASVEITAPDSGYCLVIGTADISTFFGATDSSTVSVGITDSESELEAAHTYQWFLPSPFNSARFQQVITVQRVYQVDAGVNTFYLRGEKALDATDAKAHKRYISATFFTDYHGGTK
jgi:hypothetical protein